MKQGRCGCSTETSKPGCQTVQEIQRVQPFPNNGRPGLEKWKGIFGQRVIVP